MHQQPRCRLRVRAGNGAQAGEGAEREHEPHDELPRARIAIRTPAPRAVVHEGDRREEQQRPEAEEESD